MNDAENDDTGRSDAHARRVANLKPFQPGQSGNPSGKSKTTKTVRDIAKKNGAAAIRKMVELIGSDDDRVALQAAVAILDRAVGKPTQTTKLDAKHTHRHGSESVSDTARWIEEALRERADRQAAQSVPH